MTDLGKRYSESEMLELKDRYEFMGPMRSDDDPDTAFYLIGLSKGLPGTGSGCKKRLAPGQHWAFCGETDMGQTLPALCTECGGEYKLA